MINGGIGLREEAMACGRSGALPEQLTLRQGLHSHQHSERSRADSNLHLKRRRKCSEKATRCGVTMGTQSTAICHLNMSLPNAGKTDQVEFSKLASERLIAKEWCAGIFMAVVWRGRLDVQSSSRSFVHVRLSGLVP